MKTIPCQPFRSERRVRIKIGPRRALMLRRENHWRDAFAEAMRLTPSHEKAVQLADLKAR